MNLILAALLIIGALILAAVIRQANRPAPCGHRFVRGELISRTICCTCYADVTKDTRINAIFTDPIVDFLDWWSSYPASKLKSAAIPDPPVMIQSEMHDLADLYQLEKNHAA